MRLFSTDKKKAKDEKLVYIFMIICLVAGTILAITGIPLAITFGVLLILLFVMMFIPMIYHISMQNKNE